MCFNMYVFEIDVSSNIFQGLFHHDVVSCLVVISLFVYERERERERTLLVFYREHLRRRGSSDKRTFARRHHLAKW